MTNLFLRSRSNTDGEVSRLKQRHLVITKEAMQAVKATNKLLQNGFAIKIYHAQHGEKK